MLVYQRVIKRVHNTPKCPFIWYGFLVGFARYSQTPKLGGTLFLQIKGETTF